MASKETNIITVKLKDGFELHINKKRTRNMLLMDALRESEKDPYAISDVCTLLLGKDQKQRLYDHLKDEDGIVDANDVGEALGKVFNSDELKN
ncbi:hypothetical protein [Absicoccus intestinalis]|uniref:Phage tail assembly protein n=1 Tax=Absicoccus intestinalis TaxID=2926319 RepID=A0ABU4WK72_9FIRM|nr:hypothetical protein [Absicoccus sp. CLA-KB-P134]MDX8416959.1 hypothetical protein [Absicoccus sp. CLA-KB-P134]